MAMNRSQSRSWRLPGFISVTRFSGVENFVFIFSDLKMQKTDIQALWNDSNYKFGVRVYKDVLKC